MAHDADGANQRQVRGDYVAHSIAWLPDGRLTFWGFGNNFGHPSNPPNGLYVTDTAGAEVELLLTLDELAVVAGELQGFPVSMDWSASGRGLFAARVPMEGESVCENRIPYQEDLFTVQADGSGVQRLVATAGEADLWEGTAAWSPDGSAIAFERSRTRASGRGATPASWPARTWSTR